MVCSRLFTVTSVFGGCAQGAFGRAGLPNSCRPTNLRAAAAFHSRSTQGHLIKTPPWHSAPVFVAERQTSLLIPCVHTRPQQRDSTAARSGICYILKGEIKQARAGHKRDLAITFKLHQLLLQKAYNALRRCLRVLQNPPAYTAIGWAISFPCHCKTVIGFGSPLRYRAQGATLFSPIFVAELYMVGMRGAHS